MERPEEVSSAASGSDGLTQTENDDSLSETCSEEDTLDLVEGAILRTLKRYSSQQQQQQEQERDGGSPERHLDKAGSRRRGRFQGEELHSADSVNGPAALSLSSQDSDLLADLLEQVHSLRRNQRKSERGGRRPKETRVQEVHKPARSFDRRRGREKKSSSPSIEELRVSLEAASMAAKAAADAAEAALASVAKNTEAIDYILETMKSSTKPHKANSVTDSDGKAEILKSNRLTHWILAFMAVSSIVWRFKVVKAVTGFKNKISDPMGSFKKMVAGDDEEKSDDEGNFFEKFTDVDLPSMLQQKDSDHKDSKSNEKPGEKSPEDENFLHKLSYVDLTSFLRNDSDRKDAEPGDEKKRKETGDEKKRKETNGFLSESAAAVDVKTKKAGKDVEKTAFSFANLFQVKPKES